MTAEPQLTIVRLRTAITVPLMLAMGVHPAVVCATSSAMNLFNSVAASTSFFVFGLVLLDFAVVGFAVGFFAAGLGIILMRQARQARSASGRDFERNSFTAFAIGGVILVSALLMSLEVSHIHVFGQCSIHLLLHRLPISSVFNVSMFLPLWSNRMIRLDYAMGFDFRVH